MTPSDRNTRDMETAFTGRVIASVSHEFMNVLATIRESSGLLEDYLAMDETPSQFREKIERSISIIQKQVKRGMETGKVLNKFAHSMDEPKTYLEVNDILEQVALLVNRFVRLKGLGLSVEPFEPPVRIESDPFRLQAILFLCIEYCLEHTEKGGLITLQGLKTKEGIVIRCHGQPFSGPVEETEGLLHRDPGLKILLDSVGTELSVFDRGDETGLEIAVPANMEHTKGADIP